MTLSSFSSARVATSARTRSQSLRLCSISTKRHSLEELVEEASGGRDVGRRARILSPRSARLAYPALGDAGVQAAAPSRGIAREFAAGIVADYGGEHDRAVACFRDGFEACIARLVRRCLAPPTAPFSHHAATPKPPQREQQIWACWLVAQSMDHLRG